MKRFDCHLFKSYVIGTNEYIDVNEIEGCGNEVLVDMMNV